MLKAMHHRGPDDMGFFDDDMGAGGAVRLAIIDPSPSGHQPMATTDGSLQIIYNGEVYNFKTEREILEKQGLAFSSQTDTEVILKMYQAYGDDFAKRLNGMFAIAIYDRRQGVGHERLILIRDPLGIKPLLYWHQDNRWVFASELKAILASGLIEKQIDHEAIRQLLIKGSIPQPLTIIKGVQILLPGHRLVIEKGQGKIDRYWNFDLSQQTRLANQSYPELVCELRQKLEQVVERQKVSDVPIGAFLSGGIDSTVLVALMAKLTPGSVKTFSVGFGDEGKLIDETKRAEQIARHIGTNHTQVTVTGQDVAEQLPQIISSLDQPSVDGVNSYFVAKAAKTLVTVALSGIGGDELFAGYPWFINLANYQRSASNRIIRLAYQLIVAISSWSIWDRIPIGKFSRVIGKLRGLKSFLTKFDREYQIFGIEGARRILNDNIKESSPDNSDWPITVADELSNSSPIQRITALLLRSYTQNQLLRDTDATSMANSLEVRVPYLDLELVNFVLALPESTKLYSTTRSPRSSYRTSGAKRILIDATRDLLPPDIDLQTKQGFGLPLAQWLKGPLHNIMEDTLSPAKVEQRGLFKHQVVTQIKQNFLRGYTHWSAVWLLMIVELWCREFIDQPDDQ
jgi:asparagine synthase (glutamine-hydrolysing)